MDTSTIIIMIILLLGSGYCFFNVYQDLKAISRETEEIYLEMNREIEDEKN